MNNVIFADAHEHAIKTVPEMILVYNKQATLLNIVNPGGNLPFNPEGMVGKKIDAFLDWETGRVYMKHFRPGNPRYSNLIWKRTAISIAMKYRCL